MVFVNRLEVVIAPFFGQLEITVVVVVYVVIVDGCAANVLSSGSGLCSMEVVIAQ